MNRAGLKSCRWHAVFNAPKAPPQRVSLSAARLSRAGQVMFLVSGGSKHRAVAEWRAGKDIPARAIMPAAGVDVLVEAALLVPLAVSPGTCVLNCVLVCPKFLNHADL